MLVACEGYVENGSFHPMDTLALARTPTKRRAVLTILDEPVKASKAENDMVFWAKFDQMAAASANEELRDEDFPRVSFGREPIMFSGEER